jgi:hypothetical protein
MPAHVRAALDLLHYGSFLLAAGPVPSVLWAPGPMVGTSMWFAPGDGAAGGAGLVAAKINPMFTWALGAPVMPPALNVTALYDAEHAVYVRHFQHGLVVVNPTGADAQSALPLNGSYYDPATNTNHTDLRLPRYSAAILLRGFPPADAPPADASPADASPADAPN